jgi:PadR family transcriptional regulator PadR
MVSGGNPGFMAGIPELLILRQLQDREMYGYEIVQAIRASTRETVTLSEGVVYPLLHTLERDGALKSQRRPAGPRTRVYYTLTARGVRRLFELTDNWTRLHGAVGMVLRGAHA